jgi:hypothetical protein
MGNVGDYKTYFTPPRKECCEGSELSIVVKVRLGGIFVLLCF